MTIRIPPALHDVFGETQTTIELVTVLVFGTGLAAALFVLFPEMTQGLPWWRAGLAFLLVLDVFAGSVANFTRGTNRHYASASNSTRVMFIAIHVHLPVIAWLLGMNLWYAAAVWGYTIAGALVVNALKGSRLQSLHLFAAGVLLAGGLFAAVVGADVPRYFLGIALLFMVKVLFAFPVDHYNLLNERTQP